MTRSGGRAIEITFADLVMIMGAGFRGQPGSPSDPRICGALVDIHSWSQLFADGLRQEQYGHLDIPLFDDLDAALAFMRERIASDAQALPPDPPSPA